MYLIDKKLAQTVLNYLGAQPYVKVRNMIKEMENMPDYDEILKTQQAAAQRADKKAKHDDSEDSKDQPSKNPEEDKKYAH